MKIQDYQAIIHETAVYPRNFGPAYTVLGLNGELGELLEAIEMDVITDNVEYFESIFQGIKKESGDVYWYITATSKEFKIPLENIFCGDDDKDPYKYSIEDNITKAVIMSTKISELTKKFLRDGHINIPQITEYLNKIYLYVKNIHQRYGISLEEVLEENVNKLRKRRETGTLHGSGSYREEEPQGKE